jgi:DNA-binding Lrp family transcriptional regulator
LPNSGINGEIKDKTRTTLDVLNENPTATILELAEFTDKSLRTISRELKKYQDAGLIKREGAKKNERWVVL